MNGFAAAQTGVGRNQQLRFGVINSGGATGGGKTTEHDRVQAPRRAQASIANAASGIIGM